MKTEPATRRHFKPQERLRIAESCESSGLTRSEFARRNQVSLSSLQRWLAESRSVPKESAPVFFQEVSISPPLGVPASKGWAAEIIAPDGMTVRLREQMSVEDLVRLLRGRAC